MKTLYSFLIASLTLTAHIYADEGVEKAIKKEIAHETTTKPSVHHETTAKKSPHSEAQFGFSEADGIYFIDHREIGTRTLIAQELTEAVKKEIEVRIQKIQAMLQKYEKMRKDLEAGMTTFSREALEEKKKELMELENKIKIEQAAYQEFEQRRAQELEQQLMDEVLRVIKIYAKKHNIRAVANTFVMFYVDERYLITDQIIIEMNKEYEAKRKKTEAATLNQNKK